MAITRAITAPQCYQGAGGYFAMLALANPNATHNQSTYLQETYVMVILSWSSLSSFLLTHACDSCYDDHMKSIA
jgi:hypothetical protein